MSARIISSVLFSVVMLVVSSSVFAASSSKLGIFVLAPSAGSQTIVDSQPKIIKVMDPQNNPELISYVRNFKKNNQGAIVILRVYVDAKTVKYSVGSDPDLAASDFWSNYLKPAVDKLGDDAKLFDYIAGPNEFDNTPDLHQIGAYEWTGKFWYKLAEIIGSNGFKPLLGEIAVGNIDTDKMDPLIYGLRKIKEVGGAWSYHGYTIKYSKDVNEEIWYSLRYRKFYDLFASKYNDLMSLPLIITETGVDIGGNPASDGWSARGDKEKFMDWLKWYDSEIQKDPFVLGATIFQAGSSNWSSFNVDSMADMLAAYFKGGGAAGTSNPPSSNQTGNTAEESECESAWDKVKDAVSGLRGTVEGLLQGNIPQELQKMNKTKLPNLTDSLTKCRDNTNINTVTTASKEYSMAHSQKDKSTTPTSTDVFSSLFNWSISDIFNAGNKEAVDYHNQHFPLDVGNRLFQQSTQYYQSRDLAQNSESRILGLISLNGAMQVSYTSVQCSQLPFGMGNCASGGPATAGPTGATGQTSGPYGPTGSTGGVVVSPEPPVNTVCHEAADYCSVDYLSKPEYFGDTDKARKASEICYLESRGNPLAENTHCLPVYTDSSGNEVSRPESNRTRDYSIGLFQINMLAQCPQGIEDLWVSSKECRIIDEGELDKCVASFRDPDVNIKKAVELSRNGTYWFPWTNASRQCGIIGPER